MRLTLLVLSLAVCGIAFAQERDANQKDKTGEVQGSVIEAATNQPIRHALVSLRKAEEAGIHHPSMSVNLRCF